MKKNSSRRNLLTEKNSFKHLLFIMRTIIMLFFTFVLSATGEIGYSQPAKVTINKSNVTIQEILNEIEAQTSYLFLYNNEVKTNTKKSITIVQKSVADVLDMVLVDSNIEYVMVGNHIILSTKETIEPNQEKNDKSPQQNKKQIKGIVVDEKGEPIIGANVIEIGEISNGTITDFDGNFSLQISHNARIRITYIGYLDQEISTEGISTLQVVMKEDTKTLSEVVVVGYGTQKKANLTGAVTAVKMDEVLGDRPVSNAYAALQGSVPGLTITGSSSPGQSGKSINIRGILSLNGGSPLVLIDNVPGDLNMINPEDIESVSVLKDAASSAIYGARAANGVVLVTTKRPRRGAAFQVNYNNNFGFSKSINRPEQAPLSEYFKAYLDANLSNTYWANGQNVEKWAQYVEAYKTNPDKFKTIGDGIFVDEEGIPYYLHEKDLFKNVLTTGFYNSHNVSASGGSDKVQYRMSAGYTSDDGPLITNKDYYRRMSVSSFISAEMTDWFTQELDLRYAQSKQTMPQSRGNEIYTMRLINYYPEGLMPASLTLNGKELPLFTPRNLILYGNVSSNVRNNPRIFSKSIFKPLDRLELIFEYTFDKDDFNYSYYTDKWEHTTIQRGASIAPSNDVYTRQRYYTNYSAINTYATYSKSIGRHNLKAMGGFNQESSFYELIHNQVKDQVSSIIPSLGNATGEKTLNENYEEYTIRSGFFRFNYDYKDTYLLEVNGRYDGSSKFPKTNRFGFFPSISAGWQIANEPFMNSTKKWIKELKIRGSWGQIGNQAVKAYQFSPSMNIVSADDVWLENGEKVTTIGLPSLVNRSFTWETVETINAGIDFTLFNYRLRGTYEWYQRDTKGMLTTAGVVELPAVVGTNAPAQNGADMRTRGWEFAISWKDKIGKVGYNIGFNIYDHRSHITKYANESGLLSDWYIGRELNEIWGYKVDGYYTKDDFEDFTIWKLKDGVTSIKGVNVRPGDVKFKNLRDSKDSKNQIDPGDNTTNNPGDRTVIGNSTSRYQFGANFGINFNGFDLSILLQGVGKRNHWLGGAAMFPFAGAGASEAVFQAVYYNQTDYWKPMSLDPKDPNYMIPENPNATYYRIYGQMENVGSNTRQSDKFLQNAAYLRVKNVTLSYTFPTYLAEKIQLKQLKLFLGVENLATFTSLPKGIDPERISWNYPFYSTVSFGINLTF